jgi:hypothetical protein
VPTRPCREDRPRKSSPIPGGSDPPMRPRPRVVWIGAMKRQAAPMITVRDRAGHAAIERDVGISFRDRTRERSRRFVPGVIEKEGTHVHRTCLPLSPRRTIHAWCNASAEEPSCLFFFGISQSPRFLALATLRFRWAKRKRSASGRLTALNECTNLMISRSIASSWADRSLFGRRPPRSREVVQNGCIGYAGSRHARSRSERAFSTIFACK